MAVTLNGLIYAVAHTVGNIRRRLLVCFEVVDDGSNSKSFTFKAVSESLPCQYFTHILDQCYSFMVESCGSIYIAQVGTRRYNGVHAAKVWELDLQQGIWIEVKSLGDRAFFLADHSSTWCWARATDLESTGGVKGNCMYIYRPEFAVEAVVLYRLNDCSSTVLPCPKLLNPRCFWPVWVMPQQQRLLTGQFEQGTEMSCRGVNTVECKLPPQQNENQQNYLSELPHHVIELISKQMHLFDYWSFRCASKIFQSATPAPQWRTHNSLPLFLVFENDGGSCRLMDPCLDYSRPCILKLSQYYFDIEFSKDGWLLVWDYNSLQFFNPFTRGRGEFPPLKHRYYKIGFSTYPTCSDCLTISIGLDRGYGIVLDYILSRDMIWKSCRFENNQENRFSPGYGTPIYFAGAFYFLDRNGRLGVFELVETEATWRVFDKPYIPTGKLHSTYLVECSGKLIAVLIGYQGKFVRVFEFNLSTKKWIRVKSLGDHILFISPCSGFSVVARETEMRSRIYLPWLNGKGIVYYSLLTQKYHVYDNGDVNEDRRFFTKHPSRCCWF